MNEKYEGDKLPDPDSRSQRKREVEALQDVGAELILLADATLVQCQLPPALLQAIREYKALPNKHGAQRRQIQFIGKLMRDIDDEALARIHDQVYQNVTLAKRKFQRLEQLRDALLSGDKDTVASYVTEHPEANIQLLNQLIRQARKESEQNKPPTAARKLFQLLRHAEES